MSDDEIGIRSKYGDEHDDWPVKRGGALDALVFAKWREFVSRLIDRQGTVAPDFEALYRRKAELDRKPHDPRP
jgi:hypothetical protein